MVTETALQSAKNCRKERHRFWLRLRQRSDSNFERSNISLKEINGWR